MADPKAPAARRTDPPVRQRDQHGEPSGQPSPTRPERSTSPLLRWARELALLPALLALVVLGAIVNPRFLTEQNIISIFGASAALAMVVLAESLVLITGKFDLSLESVVGIAPAVGALLVLPAANAGFGTEVPTALALVAILLVGAAVGALNGVLIVKMQLNAFIVTLAMLIILRGVMVGATKGKTLSGLPEAFLTLSTTTFARVPISVWIFAAAFAIAAFMLKYHRWGRSLYAVGGNPEAARAAGIRVQRVTLSVYVIAGVLAAIGGIMRTGYVGAISANQGKDMIFTVFAAAVIGGISLDGGRGTLFGALTGVLLLQVVDNLLEFAQVPVFWIQAISGGIILVALMIARVTTGKAQD